MNDFGDVFNLGRVKEPSDGRAFLHGVSQVFFFGALLFMGSFGWVAAFAWLVFEFTRD